MFVADGTPPIVYKLGSGALPQGLRLEPDGWLRGTPAVAEGATFAIVATNALGSLARPSVQLEVKP
jgi:Putative Ig domain